MKRIFVLVFVIGLSMFFMIVPFSLGQAYLEEIRAVECFSKLSDSLPVAQRNLGVLYYNQGNYLKALEIWQDILADSPKDADSLKNSGRAYFYLGEEEKGQEQFDKIGLKIEVEKFSPKRIPIFLVDLFLDVKFDFRCQAEN